MKAICIKPVHTPGINDIIKGKIYTYLDVEDDFKWCAKYKIPYQSGCIYFTYEEFVLHFETIADKRNRIIKELL